MSDTCSDFYTIAEVAKKLKLTDRYVRMLVARGDLPAHKFGRAVRIPADGLAVFLEARRLRSM